ncbi:hypothetical protein AVEN_173466-1 [Araneus ventricosus]|uniref:Uncharacterized protein n=1 Tax=Araneus ventricosus TaxID=182803 RepID=A0A4Y2A1L9_ARAVE|nr:hypothetical protein AVEN_173466-1 [Araneus ventricosus]
MGFKTGNGGERDKCLPTVCRSRRKTCTVGGNGDAALAYPDKCVFPNEASGRKPKTESGPAGTGCLSEANVHRHRSDSGSRKHNRCEEGAVRLRRIPNRNSSGSRISRV